MTIPTIIFGFLYLLCYAALPLLIVLCLLRYLGAC